MNTTDSNPQENPITDFYEAALDAPEPVGAGIRFLNNFIDLIIIIVLMYAIVIASLVIDGIDEIKNQYLLNILGYLIFISYYFFFEVSTGRTLGKLLTGTRVVSEAGTKPTPRQVLLRTLIRIIPFEALSFLGKHKG